MSPATTGHCTIAAQAILTEVKVVLCYCQHTPSIAVICHYVVVEAPWRVVGSLLQLHIRRQHQRCEKHLPCPPAALLLCSSTFHVNDMHVEDASGDCQRSQATDCHTAMPLQGVSTIFTVQIMMVMVHCGRVQPCKPMVLMH